MRIFLAILTFCVVGFVIIAFNIMDAVKKNEDACIDMRAGDMTAYRARIKEGHLPECGRY